MPCYGVLSSSAADGDSLSLLWHKKTGIGPRDDTERMLAAQMAAVRIATMTAAQRLAKVQTIDQRDSASKVQHVNVHRPMSVARMLIGH
jgi:hypothetical protein